MKEKVIGGEYAFDSACCNPDERLNVNLFSSGRMALYAILKTITAIKEVHVHLPDYLCSSITRTILDLHIPFSFYHVTPDFLPDLATLAVHENSVVLLINYFGMVDLQKSVDQLKEMGTPLLILDNVQALFQVKKVKNIDYEFTSYRKWLPLPDGARVYPDVRLAGVKIGKNCFAEKKITGNTLKNTDASDDRILSLLKEGEEILESDYICETSEYTRNHYNSIDFNKIESRRRLNAKCLHEGLSKLDIPHLYKEDAVPLFIPIQIERRDVIRKIFFEKSIFPPVHWPFENNILNGNTNNILYKTELSLICDQRYEA